MYSKIYLVFLFGLTISSNYAQQNLVVSGGNESGSNGSVSYSVGQIAYTNFDSSTGSINQGVQNPFEILTLSGEEFTDIVLHFTVYPNPTHATLSLNILDGDTTNLSFTLFDVNGKLLVESSDVQPSTFIDLTTYDSGIYLLHVFKQNNILKTFKIIKN